MKSYHRIIVAGVLAGIVACPSLVQGGFEFGDCPIFVRGDTNASGEFNVTDPIVLLDYLFAGDVEVPCLDALDADDSGEVNLTDAIFALQFLFLGGKDVPEPSNGLCGRDPSHDELGCESFPVCEPRIELRDFSGFEVFEYRIGPGLGFCPSDGDIYSLTLTRTESGMRLEHSLVDFREEPGEESECLFDTIDVECAVVVPQPGRELTESEVRATLEEFDAIDVTIGPDPICNCIAFDPCLVRDFSWDDEHVAMFPCSSQFVRGEQAVELREWLSRFRKLPVEDE